MTTEYGKNKNTHQNLDIVVLGASGFIGKAIMQLAEKMGLRTRPIRTPRVLLPLGQQKGDPWDFVDKTKVEEFARLLSPNSVVINAAGIAMAGAKANSTLYGANALLPVVVAYAVKISSAKRLVHVSSAAVKGRGTIDAEPAVSPFSPYSRSKALAERWLLQIPEIDLSILRPTSVHGEGRAITAAVRKLARSRLASVAGSGTNSTPQIQVETVARSAIQLATHDGDVPRLTTTPDEYQTTSSFLKTLGRREPAHVPRVVAQVISNSLNWTGRLNTNLAANARRLELLWFGQSQKSGWLDRYPSARAPRSGWESIASPANLARSPKVLFGVTSGHSVRGFFTGQLAHHVECGWRVRLVSSREADAAKFALKEGSDFREVSASRRPNVLRDALTLAALIQELRTFEPDVAVWGSPKIGFLGVIASKITKTPAIYVVHGLRLETTRGLIRAILTCTEYIAVKWSTETVAVGYQLRERLVQLGIASPSEIRVLRNGSANGIPQPVEKKDERPLEETGPEEENVNGEKFVGYVGRIAADKGVEDLAKAWKYVYEQSPNLELRIAGLVEQDRDSIAAAKRLFCLPGVTHVGHLDDLSNFYRGMGVLVLPSYREGLPTVVLEAAVRGIPSVVTDSTGTSEPVVHGATGIVVKTGSPEDIASGVIMLMRDQELREYFGREARAHVINMYVQKRLWEEWGRMLSDTRRNN